jgi:Fe-S-cluster containining protein
MQLIPVHVALIHNAVLVVNVRKMCITILLLSAIPFRKAVEHSTMAFECTQCGTCCMYLGDYIRIEEQISAYEFLAECVSTGTRFTARVDRDKLALFDDRSWSDEHPSACPFLRPVNDGRIVCTIHECSPAQCGAYRCVIMRIFTPEGGEAGRVTGTRALLSEDRELNAVWDDARKEIPFWGNDVEDRIARFLTMRGYRVE